jgi:predicted aspartyl protease
MSWKIALFLSAMAVHGSTAAQSAALPASVPPPIDGTTQTDDVKFKDDAYERMTVPVLLSGAGPFRFMVDTGADRTAVSSQLAARLKLSSGPSATLHSGTGASEVQTALVPELQLSRRSVRVVDAPLLDSEHMGADGILGVDSLRSQRVQFDFESNLMSIVPSASVETIRDTDAIVITATRRNGRLIFTEAKVNGRPVTVVLDTGAQISVANSALRRLLMGRGVNKTTEKVELHSVTGTSLTGDYAFVRELDMGGVTLKQLAVVFADAHTFRQLKLQDKPALLLGMNAIRAFKRVSIDFASRKFRVVVPESSSLDTRVASMTPVSTPFPGTGL